MKKYIMNLKENIDKKWSENNKLLRSYMTKCHEFNKTIKDVDQTRKYLKEKLSKTRRYVKHITRVWTGQKWYEISAWKFTRILYWKQTKNGKLNSFSKINYNISDESAKSWKV